MILVTPLANKDKPQHGHGSDQQEGEYDGPDYGRSSWFVIAVAATGRAKYEVERA